MKKFLIIILALVACSVDAGQTIAKVRGWHVGKVTDSMSDKTSCIAIADKYPNVALTTERLVINMRGKGGIESANHRFDKDEATSYVQTGRRSESDVWWSADMDRILEAQRLQVRIYPVIGPVVTFDLDLHAAKEINKILTSDRCK